METSATPGLSQSETTDIATEAYAYAYPLVTMEYTRRGLTNVPGAEDTKAPMGQIARMRTYPNASFNMVTAPNADTLYTQAWFDVAKEPWIVSVPDMGDRYYLLPMLDAWTNVFASPGTRNGGGKPRTFAITGPDWHGTLPPDVLEYKSPTALVWLLGRIYSSGTPEDYDAVHKLQDQITAVPLSSFGKPYLPPLGPVSASVDMKTSVRQQVNSLGAPEYFKLFARLLKTNPPAPEDAPMVAKLARIGIVPGQDFDPTKLSAAANTGLAMAPKLGQDNISGWREDGVVAGAFISQERLGLHHQGRHLRDQLPAAGLRHRGRRRRQSARGRRLPHLGRRRSQEKYSGATKYTMHFDKGQLPPVRGFWSLTMYNSDYFFVDNPLNRYTLSPRDKLATNPDGSTDLYIQADSPGRTKNPIGYRRPRIGSASCCGCTGPTRRSRRFWMGRGTSRRSKQSRSYGRCA